MNLIEKLRNQRINKSLLYYQMLVNREQKKKRKDEKVFDEVDVSRNHDIKVIQENKKRRAEQIIKTRLDVERKKERKQEEEPKKNKRIITNNNMISLKAGYLDSENKKKYIKDNELNFKNLPTDEQRQLFKIYLDFL